MKFNPVVDLGHVISAMLMIGALIGVWHALDVQARVLAVQQDEIKLRQHEDRASMQRIAEALSVVAQTQGKVLGIIDGHLKGHEK